MENSQQWIDDKWYCYNRAHFTKYRAVYGKMYLVGINKNDFTSKITVLETTFASVNVNGIFIF